MKRVKELSLERAKALLSKRKIPDDILIRVMEQIKAFCRVAYQLYSQRSGAETGSNPEKEIPTDPPDEFTNAA